MSSVSLHDRIRVRGRFHRSVHLARDARDDSALREYVLTTTGQEVAHQILNGLGQSPSQRTWSITGPYGTGKSAFALFLTALLCEPKPTHPEARRLRKEAHFRLPPFVPVILVGERTPVIPALMSALAEGLRMAAPALSRKISRASKRRNIPGREVAEWMHQAAEAVRAAGQGGLLLIVDEFGKFLEYAALHPDSEDVFIIQQLAETAARSPTPILLLTILHTAFTEYLHTASPLQKLEWQKVQGRFADVAFQEPPGQLLRLIGAAVERDLPAGLETAYCNAVRRMVRHGTWAEARKRIPGPELLAGCIPLHPATALLLWPMIRSKFAQNERSLFSFLTGQEPFGFQEFLALTSLSQSHPTFYRVDQLYDYVTYALGPAVYAGDRAHRWAEIGNALDRVSADAPALAPGVVKAIGIMALYGPAVGLHPSREQLALALGDAGAVSSALDYLEQASIIVHRRHLGAFGLWEGSDVDLDDCRQEASRHVGHGDLAERLEKLLRLRPMVARAHYVRTGALRYFSVIVIGGAQERLRECLSQPIAPADGQIVYVLTSDNHEQKSLVEFTLSLPKARGSDPRPRVFAFPKPILGLEKAVEELEVWNWISDNMPALQGDPVARREVRANILHAWERLEAVAGRTFALQGHAFDPNASDWVQGGNRQSRRTAREFLEWLSKLCDKAFRSAPDLRNELLNRDRLSSAAAKARRNLLEAMLSHEAEPHLGLIGTPPEVSMYRSLLAGGGFHQQRAGQWYLGEPNSQWRSVWRVIHHFLEATQTGRRPVLELLQLLKQPPFGMRDGPLPVVLCAVLSAHRDDVALYEDGIFVPEIRIEVLERLMRAPEAFEIQQHALAETDRKALEAVGRALMALRLTTRGVSQSSPLLRVVKPLVVFAARLPAYTKNTKRIQSIGAAAARDALLRARDPYALMRVDLPTALGLDGNSEENLKRFPRLLRDALLDLQRAYPQVLDDIEGQVRDVFGMRGASQEIRRQLQSRAVPLQGLAADRGLALFIREAARLDNADDWREVLGRTVNRGVPPSQWHDIDLVDFQVRLLQLAGDFLRLEELAAERQRTGATRILRLSLLDGHFREVREMVAVTPERAAAIETLALRLTAVLDNRGHDDDETRRVAVAALAQIAARYMYRYGRDENE